MFKKITGNILTVMLVATMFLGVAGAVLPEPANAETDPGYYEITMTIEAFTDHGEDSINKISRIELKSGTKTDIWEQSSGAERRTMVVSSLSDKPDTFTSKVKYNGDEYRWTVDCSSINEGRYTESWDVLNDIKCTYYYKVSHYHSNHKWVYLDTDNVITGRCLSYYDCKLADNPPTLTLNAEDKVYDGKPAAAATLAANDTWTTENDLPEPDQSKITYSTDSPIKAGTYTASYAVNEYSTVTKQFKINPRGVLVGGVKVENKEYDGNKTAVVDTSKAGILGVLEGDEVGLSVTGEYEDPEEGHDKNVHLTYTLTGADADNYYIIDSPTSPETVKANIYVMGNGGPDDYDEGSGKKGGSSKSSPDTGDPNDYDEGSGKKGGSSKSSPDTGDHNDITGLLAMMLVSAGALGAMGFRRRRENR